MSEQVDLDAVIDRLIADRVATRIWKKDASLWPPESPGAEPAAEIMGWLDLPRSLAEKAPVLASSVVRIMAGRGKWEATDFVVLGMGGSSMTPEVLRVVFGTQSGINLHVLDTVHPDTIRAVTESLPLASTIFSVASKSGTTVEPLSLEKHFRAALVDAGVDAAKLPFSATTDPNTPLAQRADAGEFIDSILTPPDVGGRFSALTAFGMRIAVVMGLDIKKIASSAASMTELCSSDEPHNPGLTLGANLGAHALAGRDKVTLITSPGLERFGLWVEQLLAESTGKDGKGLIPVAGEPVLSPEHYGSDRNFIYLRLDGADNTQADAATRDIESAGHPVTTLVMRDLESIGGEFFRWQFAVAVAGHVLGIFPFDQPDVNAAKDAARSILESGNMPSANAGKDLKTAIAQLIETPKPGDYVAIGAFMPESPEVEKAFARLRTRINLRTNMATTFGFGPRYLHSTGQLYKGGPDSVRFLGVISHGSGDITVPGESYTLGALTSAQAYGDFEVMRHRGRRIQTAVIGSNAVAEIEEALRD